MSLRLPHSVRLSLLLLLSVVPGGAQQGDSLSEEEKKRRFLKAREEIAPTPLPQRAPPSPANAPHPKPRPKRTSEGTSAPKVSSDSSPSSEPPPRAVAPPKAEVHPPKAIPSAVPSALTPTPPLAPSIPSSSPDTPIVIEKSSAETKTAPLRSPSLWDRLFSRRHSGSYKYLTQNIRDEIDRASVASGRWKYIVIHNSGTRQGNAKAFDYYHTHVRKMSNGLAYHFVIGNGTSSGNGQVEIGQRWKRQMSGGHVHSDYLNSIALGVCLVGDFNQDKPKQEQLDALDELIRYLRERVGKTEGKWAIVKAHREINPPRWPTDCPGSDFPYTWLHARYD